MKNILLDLINAGFVIFQKDDKFIMENDLLSVKSVKFNTCDEAITAALNFKVDKKIEWCPIVRYNRGLGIEYKNLMPVFAVEREEAKRLAEIEAVLMLEPKAVISEVKVYPKI